MSRVRIFLKARKVKRDVRCGIGYFFQISRDALKELIIKHEGKQSAVSASTSFLVAGENMGPAKLDKATRLGIKIITENDFFKLID